MRLSEKHIKSFQELYKQLYGIELSYDEAHEQALCITQVIKAIYKPIPVGDVKNTSLKR